MTLGVMFLDMFELCGFLEGGDVPIEIFHPAMDCGVSGSDVFEVTFEVLDVDGIETNDGGEESDVKFREVRAKVVWTGTLGGGKLSAEVGFDAVEGFEEGDDVAFVCFLASCKARLVDAVVDVVVGPFVGGLDFGAEGLWIEVEISRMRVGRKERVEAMVKHADNLGGFVVYDAFSFGVIKDWDSEAAFIIRFAFIVDVLKMGEVRMDWVGSCIVARYLVLFCKPPTFLQHLPMNRCYSNVIL